MQVDSLVAGEKAYVEGLDVLVRAFIRPLSRWADELEVKREAACAQEQKAAPGMKRFVPPAEVTRADVARVVSNAEELYANQTHLLSALEAAHKAGGSQAVIAELLDKVMYTMLQSRSNTKMCSKKCRNCKT
jgi:hypothetical protein